MKPKTIKSVLSKKFNNWLDSIEDEEVQKIVKKNAIITGGSIVSLLLNEKPKDYDIYFKTKEAVKTVAQYYVDKWNEMHPSGVKNAIGNVETVFVLDGSDVEEWKHGSKPLVSFCPNYTKELMYGRDEVSHMITNTPEDRIKIIYPSSGVVGEPPTQSEMIDGLDDLSEITEDETQQETNPKYRPLFLTTNAISLSDGIQLVIRFYGDAEKIHETYDFEHCCCYWEASENLLVTPERSLLAIMNKDLFYRGSKYPICSVIRSRKFIKRGWNINAGQYLKMCFQVSELNLKDVDILEDQLVGIDTIYFLQIVNAIRSMKEKDSAFVFDNQYLTTIIDRIF